MVSSNLFKEFCIKKIQIIKNRAHLIIHMQVVFNVQRSLDFNNKKKYTHFSIGYDVKKKHQN